LIDLKFSQIMAVGEDVNSHVGVYATERERGNLTQGKDFSISQWVGWSNERSCNKGKGASSEAACLFPYFRLNRRVIDSSRGKSECRELFMIASHVCSSISKNLIERIRLECSENM
jgi:hypothetical protein